jgi:sugar phosphate isomerase/epimerase
MGIRSERPIYISVSQYMDELAAGTMKAADVVEKARALGADGVELRREPWPDHKRELSATRQHAELLGLGITFATHNLLFSPDEEAHQLLLDDVGTAATLGSPLLRIFPGQTPPEEDRPGWAGAVEAVEHAASCGIAIALENYVGMPGGTLAEIVHILDRIQSPALKTNIDIGNYVARGQDVIEAIHTVGHRAAYAHLKDRPADPAGPHTYLGDGEMALQPILTELEELPQEMIYCFEFPGGGDPEGRIKKSLAYLGRE